MALSDEEVVRRLALVKYLLRQGEKQALQPEPLAATSILPLHDCVELFVHLAAEHLDVNVGKKADFLQYWDAIPRLTHLERMKKLNVLRVAFKHHGVLPARPERMSLPTTVRDFLTENTQTIFGRDFGQISLADLVALPIVREYLSRALAQREAGEAALALESVAAAFYELTSHPDVMRDAGLDAFTVGRDLHRAPSAPSIAFQGETADLRRFLEDTKAAIESLQKRMRLLLLGIDLRAHQRFRFWTPMVHRLHDGKGTLHIGWPRTPDTSVEAFQACFDFVIDAALGLQQGDHPLILPAHPAPPR